MEASTKSENRALRSGSDLLEHTEQVRLLTLPTLPLG